jgi:hypothetical protein
MAREAIKTLRYDEGVGKRCIVADTGLQRYG